MDAPTNAPRSLFHEWFVEYDPRYLASAALVLGGLTLLSRELAGDLALAGLGVAAVAELYALCLIGAAAILVRIGARRIAVMVGLLAALYQCDLTMHVETSAYLGALGALAALAWVALFAIKLRLLAAALELRPSRSALVVPTLGAAALALLPQLFRHVAPDARTPLVALAVFAIGAAALWTSRSIESAVGFDYRGRRAIRGTWLMWAGAALLHVAWWSIELGVEAAWLLPGAALLTTRWARRERHVWAIASLALVAVALVDPTRIPITALMVSVVLALRALRAPITTAPARAQAPSPPYRGPVEPPASPIDATPKTTFVHADPIAIERLLLGAVASAHLAVWTLTTPATLWIEHQPALDLALVAICALAAWRGRRWQSLAPLAALFAHLSIQLGWVTMPRGALEWGASSVALGFALLGAAIGTTWRASRSVRASP